MNRHHLTIISVSEACSIYGGTSKTGKDIAYTIGKILGEIGKAISKLISNIKNDSEKGPEKK